MAERFSRREFLKVLAAITGGSGIILAKLLDGSLLKGLAQSPDQKSYLPFIRKDIYSTPTSTATSSPTPTGTPTAEATPSPTPTSTNLPSPPPTGSRVVHVYDAKATFWDANDPQYWNYVNQDEVITMVDQGLISLTGTSTVADAWQVLLPNYHVGQGIAIKVNFNNTQTCGDMDGQIDAVMEPVNAIVRGLKMIGVVEPDIWVFDAIRAIPDRFVNKNQFSNIQFYGGCRNSAGFGSSDPYAEVTFSMPADVPEPAGPIRITDLLISASYVINVPIMKPHGWTGTTLAFKNHLGSINRPDLLHDYLMNMKYYRPDYSPLVDVYKNPHILGKTILTIGDGLFGCPVSNILPPRTWSTFDNNVPNSLFFATDPVSVDCVMTDFLQTETPSILDPNYLPVAGAAGLGTYERGDPWGAGYGLIDYLRIDL